jgi:hypothetical protein
MRLMHYSWLCRRQEIPGLRHSRGSHRHTMCSDYISICLKDLRHFRSASQSRSAPLDKSVKYLLRALGSQGSSQKRSLLPAQY